MPIIRILGYRSSKSYKTLRSSKILTIISPNPFKVGVGLGSFLESYWRWWVRFFFIYFFLAGGCPTGLMLIWKSKKHKILMSNKMPFGCVGESLVLHLYHSILAFLDTQTARVLWRDDLHSQLDWQTSTNGRSSRRDALNAYIQISIQHSG